MEQLFTQAEKNPANQKKLFIFSRFSDSLNTNKK